MTDDLDQTDTMERTEMADPTTEQHVEVRRNVGLSALVGGFSALLTVAFAVRAFTDGSGLDWLLFGVLALVTVAHLAALADSRAPLLVADPRGVRLRRGAEWRGIAWDEVDCLEHLPRRGLLHDGHILVDGYDDQQLVVPLTLATRITGTSLTSLSDVLAELADGRADVVEVVPGLEDQADTVRDVIPSLSDLYSDDERVVPVERHGIAARVSAGLTGADEAVDPADVENTDEILMSAQDPESHEDSEDPEDMENTDEIDVPLPGRDTVLPARVEVEHTRAIPSFTDAPHQAGALADSDTMTVVLDDLAVRPAERPIIGPDLVAARERLRLTIDQLSERTRIRPHVIEAMEVDDFGPCGGDFYARGHLRTLARVLGVDAGPLVASYDETYGHGPVDARRVFESELATGSGGAIRSTRGGRNWSVLIAAVMAAILVWSIARLVMDGPAPVGDTPVLNQSGGIIDATAAKGDPVKLTLTAAGGGAQLVVRDGAGEVVFDGNLAFGQTSELRVIPPVRIWSSDGSVTYALGQKKAAALGDTGTEVSKTLVAR